MSVSVTSPFDAAVDPVVIVILAPFAAADIPPPTKVISLLAVAKVVASSKSIISVLAGVAPSLAAVVNLIAPLVL